MSDDSREAPYRVHRMIQGLLRDPIAARAFATDPQATFEQYGITPAEAVSLEAQTIEAMDTLGVHPNLQMKYLRLRKSVDPSALQPAGPLDAYLPRLLVI